MAICEIPLRKEWQIAMKERSRNTKTKTRFPHKHNVIAIKTRTNFYCHTRVEIYCTSRYFFFANNWSKLRLEINCPLLLLLEVGAYLKAWDQYCSELVGTAIQLVILPHHIPWIGQEGSILLLHYSMIWVTGLSFSIFNGRGEDRLPFLLRNSWLSCI